MAKTFSLSAAFACCRLQGLWGNRKSPFCWIRFILLLAGPLAAGNAQSLRLEISLTNGPGLLLRWNSSPGVDYQLQRSLTNRLPASTSEWGTMLSLRALGTVTVVTDTNSSGFSQRYYRLVQLTNAPPPPFSISPVQALPLLGGALSSTMLRVSITGTQFVSSVVFLENGVALGGADPDLGDAWSYALPWDGRPRIRRIVARVITANGTTNDTPVTAFLQADPAKFVPLRADGSRAYGEFVSADDSNRLAAFVFFPEGAGEPAAISGAHFEFPPGATLRTAGGVNEIEFNSANFHRGHRDIVPLAASAGLHRINIDAVTPPAVATALGLPAGTPLQLKWSSVPLDWVGGALGEAGWGNLMVQPFLGGFVLPGNQECALVSFDPKGGNPTLVICYHGDWSPFSDGPQFRIPRSEPLKIYLSASGKIAAQGTVEATFNTGATVRGSVSWREPNFEVRFQARNIVIPGFTSLKRALPANPEQVIPAGSTTAELDAAAQALASYRDAYRTLAMGGSAEANLASGESLAPLGQSTDSAGVALEGWAARLSSWTADRAGQSLDAEMISDLRKVAENGAKTCEAAHDAPTALKLLRDFMLVKVHAPTAAGAGADVTALLAALEALQPRYVAAVKRILGESPITKPGPDLTESIRLLKSISARTAAISPAAKARVGPRQANDAGLTDEEINELVNFLFKKVDPVIFSDRGIVEFDFDGTDNRLLESHSIDELLDFMDQIQDSFDLLVANHILTNLDQSFAPFLLDEAVTQTKFWVQLRHEEVCDEAIDKGDVASLVGALRQRLRIFDRYAALGVDIPPDGTGFLPPIAEIALALEEPFARRLQSVPLNDRLKPLEPLTKLLNQLSAHVRDPALSNYLDGAWLQLSDANSVILAALSGAGDCDELEGELRGAEGGKYKLLALPLGNEGSHRLPITGKYESEQRARALQINQAGRYLSGYVEFLGSRQRLEGLMTKDRADLVEFAIVQHDSAGNALYGTLSGALSGQRMRLTVKRDTGTPFTETFIQTTIVPVFAESVIESFTNHARVLVASIQRHPLHSRQITTILESLPTVVDIIEDFVAAGSDHAAQLPSVSRFNTLLSAMREKVVAGAQVPQWTLIYQQVLSKFRPEGSTRTYWENVMVMFANHSELMPVAMEMLGRTNQINNQTFTYDITVNAAGPGITPEIYKLGLLGIKVHVAKSSTAGAADSFDLIGGVAQGGIGAELKFDFGQLSATTNIVAFLQSVTAFAANQADFKGGVVEINEHQVVQSIFDYRKEDLEGPVLGLSGEAGVGLELPTPFGTGELKLFKVSSSGLAFMGSGLLPPLCVVNSPPPEGPGTSLNRGQVSFKGGFEAGLTATAGYVWQEGNALEELTKPSPVRFKPTQNVIIESAVFFDEDSDVIKPCGWQFLRRFASEYAAIFLSPSAQIRILGMTDTTQTDAYNDDLSRRRANSVKSALQTILGPFLAVRSEDVIAVGLGELAARNGVNLTSIPALTQPLPNGQPSLASNEPWVINFLSRRRVTLGTIADNVNAPEWRSVVILLNNTAVVEMTAPGGPTP